MLALDKLERSWGHLLLVAIMDGGVHVFCVYSGVLLLRKSGLSFLPSRGQLTCVMSVGTILTWDFNRSPTEASAQHRRQLLSAQSSTSSLGSLNAMASLKRPLMDRQQTNEKSQTLLESSNSERSPLGEGPNVNGRDAHV